LTQTAVRRPTIGEIVIADRPQTWRELGFHVPDESFVVGTVTIRLAEDSDRTGIVEWALRDALTIELDGLPTRYSRAVPLSAPAGHPNGALAIDHVVVLTSSLDRTAAALDDAGVQLRRVREAGSPRAPARQGFFRLGEVILEVVQQGGTGDEDGGPAQAPDAVEPARFWGVVFVVADLDDLGDLLGDHLGEPRDAVQPGRRIATLQPSAGAALPVAFITPDPGRRV
jgi:hypothetical protein